MPLVPLNREVAQDLDLDCDRSVRSRRARMKLVDEEWMVAFGTVYKREPYVHGMYLRDSTYSEAAHENT
jgi:hypothetical protein